MRGFIDLIFCHNSKYYIIDWKTNNLGNHYDDYSYENLAKSMTESLYCLQYYIYTVALHKYLKNRISDYDYNAHFGGVFYLYIRGIHPNEEGKGIYYDKPPFPLIEDLCFLFDGN
jgi:exodeoxyribonuclease V beta subunit